MRSTILALVLLVALSFGAAALASASPVVQQDGKPGQVSGGPAQSADEAGKEQADEAPAPDGPGQTADSSPGDPAAGQQSQQGSTTKELLARRRAKFDRLAPPERDGVESGLHWLETSYVVQRIRAGWHGFHPKLGGLPSGAGQAFGVVWRQDGIGVKYPDERTPNKVDFELGAAASIRGYLLVGTDLAFRRIAASPFNLQFHAGYQRNTQDDFFGFGPESREEDRTDFLYEQTGGGVAVWWQAPQWLSIGGAASYRDNNVASGTDPLFLSTPAILQAMEAFLKGKKLRRKKVSAPEVTFIAPRRVADLSPEVLERYVGSYRIEGGGVRKVVRAGSLLYTQRDGGRMSPIRPSSSTEFFYETLDAVLRFELDDAGRPTRMIMHQPANGPGVPATRE